MAQAATAKQKVAPAPAVQKVPVWKWTGKTRAGEVRSGEMEAHDASAVQARLAQMGIEPTRTVRSKSPTSAPAPPTPAARPGRWRGCSSAPPGPTTSRAPPRA